MILLRQNAKLRNIWFSFRRTTKEAAAFQREGSGLILAVGERKEIPSDVNSIRLFGHVVLGDDDVSILYISSIFSKEV
jgi:hypothetical protein